MNAIRITYLTLAALCAAVPAICAGGPHFNSASREQTVSFAGLDLTQAAGVEILYRRIRAAAKSVCQDLYTLDLGDRRALWDRCVENSMAHAIANVDSPALAALHLAKTAKLGKPVTVAGTQ